MIFKKYSELEGQHAFLSPSSYHWLNYDRDKLVDRFLKAQAVERGTRLHQYAHDAIVLNRMQPRNKDTVNMFINDAIGYKMSPEQPLYYHRLCFGTSDAVQYNRNYLRIFDLKTGETEAHMEQLRIYAALLCLDYQGYVSELRAGGWPDPRIAAELDLSVKELHFDPERMSGIELRIYQFGEVRTEMADPKEIRDIMEIIKADVEILKEARAGGNGDGQ